jgi:PAS domain S-box-containing protein
MSNIPSRTVLIIDGSAEERERYRDYLQRDNDSSYIVLQAELGRQGLELWRQADVILLNQHLPDLDGWEFLAQLLSSANHSSPNPSVILIAEQDNEKSAMQAIEAGAEDYLLREQITPGRLQLAVKRALTVAQLRRERHELHQQVQAERIERKRVETELRESESHFRQLTENIDAVFWIREEPEGRVSYVSPGYERLWGLNPQKLYDSRQVWLDYVHPDDQESTDRAFQEKASLGKFDQEYRIVLPDGSIRWIRDRCFPLQDQTGKIYRFTGVAEDITERKQAEEAIATNEARLRGFVDSNVVGILYGDIYGNIHDANDELLQIIGYTREELRSGELSWVNITPPEDLVLDQYSIAEDRANGACTPYEKSYIRKDGSRVPVLVGYSLFGEAREESVAFILDLSERKQAGEALRLKSQEAEAGQRILDALMDYVPEGIMIADAPNVTIRRVSRYGRELVGRSAEAFEGLPVEEHASKWDVFLADGITPATSEVLPLSRAVQQGEVVTDEEWVLRRPDGSKITVLCSAGPIYVDGEITGGVLVWRDISDRVRFERDREHILQQEQAARAAAERANRIKDEFLAVLSHELRSPLNPILGWTKLLQSRQFTPERVKEALAVIERNAKLQAQLIDDLLDISRIMRGKLSLTTERVSLPLVVAAALETVWLSAEAKQIQIEMMLESEVDMILGDAARLQQVVWNLLSNAVKFTPEGGQIRVQLARVSGSPDFAQLSITDTGKGIKSEFLPHLFEYFRQEDASTTRQFGGLGLGLAIVRQIVEMHGGMVAAESRGEGQGATFMVRLPLRSYQNESSLPNQRSEGSLIKPAQPSALPSRLAQLAGVQLLVVDDDLDTLDFYQTTLAAAGAVVIAANSVAEALSRLTQFTPDLLLSDIGMPNANGYMLIRQVQEHEAWSKIPAIALTAYASDTDREQALAAGFQAHLSKPVDADVLIRTIVQLLISS